MTSDRVSNERLAEIEDEYHDMAKSLTGELKDGSGAASAFYMTCSLGEIASMARELQSLRSPVTVSDDLSHAAQFLVDRLDDFERGALQEDDGEYVLRQFGGHVSPAMERLRDSLTAALIPAEQEGESLPKLENCGRYLAQDNTGQWHYINHAGTWQTCPPPFPDAPTPSRDNRVVAWGIEMEGGYASLTDSASMAGIWRKEFGCTITALVPLSSLEAVERERDTLETGLIDMHRELSTAEASLAAAEKRTAELEEVLKLAIPSTYEFDEESNGYYDTSLTIEICAALAGSNGE